LVLDVRMPGLSGIDLVPKVLEIEPNAAILMLTAVNDATTASLCMQRGAMEYLTKPIDLEELHKAIQRALKRRDALLESDELNKWLKEEVAVRTAELRREQANLQRISVATLEVLVNALEAKDPYSRGHSARIADLSAMVAAEMGLEDEDVESVRTAGRLHDIGKIGIREEVLVKQGPLTDSEYEHVKQHVVVGSQILAPLTHLREVIHYVRSHHERWDGRGYPDGLKGEEIPIGARILAAVEVYDALTTSRPYQEKMSSEFAVERMRDLTGAGIATEVFDALEAVVSQRQTLVFLDDAAQDKSE
jgi:putative nucleotidyltransferase with HDIG domain